MDRFTINFLNGFRPVFLNVTIPAWKYRLIYMLVRVE